MVEGPADQASEVVRCLAALDGRYRADQIVVGVLDEMLVPQLLRRLQESHVAARWVVGKTVRETAPYRLLDALANYMERGRYHRLRRSGSTSRPDPVAGRRRASKAIGSPTWTTITTSICRRVWSIGWATTTTP